MLVIPRVLCFITHGDDVLLLRGAPDKRLWANRYNGIGGHVEPGEDVYSAARREIQEEAGIPITELRLRGVISVAPDGEDPGILLFVFTARALSRDVHASAEGQPVWIPRSQIGTLDAVEDVPLILEWVSEMGSDDPVFSARST
ncbi:MAG: NUDIX domain-containing protein, partial [Thermoflexales bacterium]|nr:NUDIX domain-containing protein [Thermoflexales bacterium]